MKSYSSPIVPSYQVRCNWCRMCHTFSSVGIDHTKSQSSVDPSYTGYQRSLLSPFPV